MCEFTLEDIKNSAIRFLFNNPLQRVFPQEVIERFPFGLIPFMCPICGKHLSEYEMKPAKRASRSLCNDCYEYLILNSISHQCLVCGSPLPSIKIQHQALDKREIRNHIEEGDCFHRWSLIHSATLNETDIQAAIESKLTRHISDYTQQNKRIPLPIKNTLKKPMIAFKENESHGINCITTYKGKPVKYLS